MEAREDLSEPWFTLVKLGIKTVEVRRDRKVFALLKEGDYITFTNRELGFVRTFQVQITNVLQYDSFLQYLEVEGLENTLPGIDTIEDGLRVYYKYYPSGEDGYKIKAFEFKLI